jgi:hypothetical protein
MIAMKFTIELDIRARDWSESRAEDGAFVDLAALLSNFETEILFQRLTNRDWRQVARAARVRSDRSRDGVARGLVSILVIGDSSLSRRVACNEEFCRRRRE